MRTHDITHYFGSDRLVFTWEHPQSHFERILYRGTLSLRRRNKWLGNAGEDSRRQRFLAIGDTCDTERMVGVIISITKVADTMLTKQTQAETLLGILAGTYCGTRRNGVRGRIEPTSSSDNGDFERIGFRLKENARELSTLLLVSARTYS